MVVRGICISDSMPSCMRAPPEETNRMKGRFSATAASHRARRSASPTPMPERAAQEIEGLHRDHHRQAVDRAARGGQRFVAAGLGAGRLHLVGVALLAAEAQRIGGHLRRRQFVEDCRVEGAGETLGRADAHVMAALRADIQIAPARSRWKIISPQAEHFFQRFSGVSRPPSCRHQALDAGTDEIGDPVHALHLSTRTRPHAWNRPEPRHSSSTVGDDPARARPFAGFPRHALTMAEPTTARVGDAGDAPACSGVLMPKPTAQGRCAGASDARQRRAAHRLRRTLLVPVTPAIET